MANSIERERCCAWLIRDRALLNLNSTRDYLLYLFSNTGRRQLWQSRDLVRSNHALMSLATESRVLSPYTRHHKSWSSDDASSSTISFYLNRNDLSRNIFNFNSSGSNWIQTRLVHSSSTANSDEGDKPSSKVEETVKNIKQDLKDKEKGGLVPEPKRSLWKRIEDEVSNSVSGFLYRV